MPTAHLEVTMRYRIDQVKTDPEDRGDSDGGGGNPSGGCGDGQGCGRQ
ncbi:hypothetical protein [Streptomyces sp. NPDC051310]